MSSYSTIDAQAGHKCTEVRRAVVGPDPPLRGRAGVPDLQHGAEDRLPDAAAVPRGGGARPAGHRRSRSRVLL